MTSRIVSIIMIICLILILIDLGITYYGVEYLGMVEGSLIIGARGLIPGSMIVLVVFSFIAFLLWVLRKSRIASTASISGLVLMCAVELFAIIHNIFMVFS
jgi:hypothetical protein